MNRLVVLDAGPVGLAGRPPRELEAARCLAWIEGLRRSGSDVAVPEIARYEVRRELVRIGATAGLRRLDGLHPACLFLPITTAAIERAAELWAQLRRAGLPTAGPEALDGDAILAAQALVASGPGREVLIATTNAGHLARFPGVDARDWRTIA